MDTVSDLRDEKVLDIYMPCHAQQLQSCPTLCNPMDCSLPGSTVPEISQARILEWVAFPSPGDLANPGIKSMSPALAGRFFTTELSGKHVCLYVCIPDLMKFQFLENEAAWTLFLDMKMKVLVAQLCPTFGDPMGCSPSGSSVHGISQERILKWVAIPFSKGSS